MIRDQRSMHGVETREQVAQHWADFLAGLNAQRAKSGDAPLELLETAEKLAAYVNWGRWVADCSVCAGGISCWDKNPRGACLDCGTVFKITFPADAKKAEPVLLARKDERHRNWRPDRETVADLKADNAKHPEQVTS